MFGKEQILRLRATYSRFCAGCGKETTELDRVLCSIAAHFKAYCSRCVQHPTVEGVTPPPPPPPPVVSFPNEDTSKTVSAHPSLPVSLLDPGKAMPISGDATAMMRHYNRCVEAYGHVTPRQLIVLRFMFMGARKGVPVMSKHIKWEQGQQSVYWGTVLEQLRKRGIVKLSAPRQYVLA